MTTKPSEILWQIRNQLPSLPWDIEELCQLVEQAGFDRDNFCIAIEGSPTYALKAFFQELDHKMLAITQQNLWNDLKTSAKIKHLLIERYRLFSENEILMQSILAFLKKPENWGLSLQLGYGSLNTIWYAAGDTATDYNFYTKRALLAWVHSSGLRIWAQNPHDPKFLESKIDDALSQVHKIGQYKSELQSTLKPLTKIAKNFLSNILASRK